MARLEQAQAGDDGARVWGLACADPHVGAGPGMVTVGPTGEHLTEAAFAARYPRGILIEMPALRRDAPTGDEAA